MQWACGVFWCTESPHAGISDDRLCLVIVQKMPFGHSKLLFENHVFSDCTPNLSIPNIVLGGALLCKWWSY